MAPTGSTRRWHQPVAPAGGTSRPGPLRATRPVGPGEVAGEKPSDEGSGSEFRARCFDFLSDEGFVRQEIEIRSAGKDPKAFVRRHLVPRARGPAGYTSRPGRP